MAFVHDRPVHLGEYQERPRVFQAWERIRDKQAQWVVDCVSEALGVFFYCFAGVGAQTAWILGNYLGIPGLGSLFTTGLAYALGIVFAITVCSSQNGGHFHPGVTITAVLFKKFPVRYAIRHIIAQLLGGYIACLLIYLQWKHVFTTVEAGLAEAGHLAAVQFTPTGPAGAIALYAAPGASLGLIFINEFVSDFMIGVIIWASVDNTNYYIPPVVAPWLIGAAYAVAVWGYSPVGLAASTPRDVGGRLAALTIWGIDASGGRYAAIAALTNIPATIAAYIFYEIFFADSCRVVIGSRRTVIEGHKAQAEFRKNKHATGPPLSPSSDLEEKGASSVAED
ncbi:hypothetical protein EWM64_g6352 [Hericium alpestre]|uniref:Aquaporin-like protein n=1 Tax=Hericium alpestre TaxID=135208 RepID=A0A4Y9ZVZ3_9AGAM|nr:hypothetical protein EWM64_g6352 [Hericium alpestre]